MSKGNVIAGFLKNIDCSDDELYRFFITAVFNHIQILKKINRLQNK